MIVAAMILAAASGGVSAPQPSVVEPAFTATIVSTYPDGRISKLWLNRDGTFTTEGRKHEMSGGRWVMKGASICMRQTKPIPIPFAQYCAPIPQNPANETWAGKAVTGEPITIRVVPGR